MKLANSITFLTALAVLLAGGASAQTEHFDPKGKPPSVHTLEILKQARTTLPFSDTRDFDEEKKGFIAAPDSWKIKGEAGNVVWDMERYKFFLEGKDFDSIHPSLQRQGTLNMNFGNWSTNTWASGLSRPWSTRIPTATTGVVCAALSTRPMCGPARSRSLRPVTLWTMPFPRMSMPATP
jgi:hypothetical protein